MNTIEIKNWHFRCEIAPDLGGAIIGLWCGEVPILREAPGQELSSALEASSYALVPYSNRIENGKLFWQNKTHQLPPNLATEPHAIHGVGWTEKWHVLSLEKTKVILRLEHSQNEAWPWSFNASQSFELLEHGLLSTLSVTNNSAESMPTGLGWHPYFSKRSEMQIAFLCNGRWELDENSIPNSRSTMDNFQAPCAHLVIDNCHDGWNGVVNLIDPEFTISVESTLKHLVVYSTPTSACIAIEPVSHVSNALAMIERNQMLLDESGIVSLEPGGTFANQMMIAIHKSS